MQTPSEVAARKVDPLPLRLPLSLKPERGTEKWFLPLPRHATLADALNAEKVSNDHLILLESKNNCHIVASCDIG
jgi:hypothetical protein